MFHPLSETDLPMILERQKKLQTCSSEFDAFRLFVWLPLDQTEVAYWRDQFALRFKVGREIWYIAPPEIKDFQVLLQELMAYERVVGGKTFHFLHVDSIPSGYPQGFIATPIRDLFDYLYRAEDLITLKGRSYAAKRNQIAQFKRKYFWHFEPLSAANADACLGILDFWDGTHEGGLLEYEHVAINRMLSYPIDLGQSGGVLFADGQPAAFTIGSHPRAPLLDILAEKALPQFTGAYPMMMNTYAQYAYSLAPYTCINREEDMGLENLRQAKLQLEPERLVEKTLMIAPL